jgi:hypothetical protein
MQAQTGQPTFLERFFKLREKNTTVRTEIIAGFTTFIAFIIVIWSLIVDVSIDNLKRTQLVNSKKQEVSLGQVPVAPLAGNQQNLEAILQQAIAAQTAQAAGGQAPQQPQVAQPEQVQQTPSDFLIKSLN